MKQLRLGVNIDHIATVRNARGGSHPDPVMALFLPKLLVQMVLPLTCGKIGVISVMRIFMR
ncbi:MAG: hypothetical protein CM15mP80_01370 [Alphaproteobacteria bacterium]|nr:MAG: hypothetical protein CM15mP80_01370 [Alphaproteobacteria bacterium]